MKIVELTKTNANGKKQYWKTTITDKTVTTCFGIIGGKEQNTIKPITNWTGKNIGKKNETTPLDQAIFETLRKARKKVEAGYNIINGKELIQEATTKTVVKVNAEIPKPTLAKNASPYSKDHKNSMRKIENEKTIIVQHKLDGNRAIVDLKNGEIYSRTRKKIISVPHLVKKVQEACKYLPDFVQFVDGELFSPDLTFNEIQSIIRKSKETTIDFEKAKLIKFNMFDYISDEEQIIRLETAADYVNNNDSVKLLDYFEIDFKDIQKYHDKFVADGDEGVIIRFKNDGGYQQKRSNTLYKFKNFVDDEFKVVSMYSEKNNTKKLGGMTLIDSNGEEFNARPSFTHEEMDYMFNNQNEYIGKMATVRYQKIDDVTGVPIFGTIKGFRAVGDL